MSETVQATRLVLVVDDDAGVRDVVVTLLELSDHDVLAASGGAEALRMLAANPAIDLVVSDVRMPGMSGIELAAQVGARHPGVPVVLISGYFQAEKDGVHFLKKPFSLEELQAAVLTALRTA